MRRRSGTKQPSPANDLGGTKVRMTSRCTHQPESRLPTTPEVAAGLEAASARLAALGGQLTRPRRRVLELLLRAGAPTKAYDLVNGFHPDHRLAKPATIYRALHFLEASGLVSRLASNKSYVASEVARPGSPAAFLLCDCCGACRQISLPAVSLGTATTAAGYTIARVTIEAHGLCAACRPS